MERFTARADRASLVSLVLAATCSGAACSSHGGITTDGGGPPARESGQSPAQATDDASIGAQSADIDSGPTDGFPWDDTMAEASDGGSTGAQPGDSGSGSDTLEFDATDAPGDDAMTEAAAPVCQNDPSLEVYSDNLEQMGTAGQIDFVLVSSKPAPPATGINTLVLRLLDTSGNPITAATITPIKLYMPYMRHGSSVVPTVTSNGDGTYTIKEVDLIMAGIWQFTFTGQSGSVKDTTTYTFCVHNP